MKSALILIITHTTKKSAESKKNKKTENEVLRAVNVIEGDSVKITGQLQSIQRTGTNMTRLSKGFVALGLVLSL